MFTGLIEAIGTLVEATRRRGSKRMVFSTPFDGEEIALGESIAVDGVCVTVVDRAGKRFSADVVEETLLVSKLDGLSPGARVNLERALRMGDRLGGHFVLGHVDATARIVSVRRRDDDCRLTVGWTRDIRGYVARKGSVAVDGVSLTVSRVAPAGFEVALVPETLARTNLADRRAGDPVHVEVDVLARYLEARRMGSGPRGPRSSGRPRGGEKPTGE